MINSPAVQEVPINQLSEDFDDANTLITSDTADIINSTDVDLNNSGPIDSNVDQAKVNVNEELTAGQRVLLIRDPLAKGEIIKVDEDSTGLKTCEVIWDDYQSQTDTQLADNLRPIDNHI